MIKCTKCISFYDRVDGALRKIFTTLDKIMQRKVPYPGTTQVELETTKDYISRAYQKLLYAYASSGNSLNIKCGKRSLRKSSTIEWNPWEQADGRSWLILAHEIGHWLNDSTFTPSGKTIRSLGVGKQPALSGNKILSGMGNVGPHDVHENSNPNNPEEVIDAIKEYFTSSKSRFRSIKEYNAVTFENIIKREAGGVLRQTYHDTKGVDHIRLYKEAVKQKQGKKCGTKAWRWFNES